ncbi:S49 family peptidase [Empedobacter falsenii]
MKVLNELRNGLWAFDAFSAINYFGIVDQFLAGKLPVNALGDKPEAISYLANDYGEKVSPENLKEKTYAVVELIGPVTMYDTCFSWGAESIVRRIEMYNNDDRIKGIILKTDTPGGSVQSINPFIDFASKKKKALISLCDNALSLGQWSTDIISDHKMASNTISARFGSIGVVSSFYGYKKMLENQGVDEHVVYADQSDWKGKVFEQALEGDYKLLKSEYLNPMAEKFQNAVIENRPNLDQSVEGILNGRTFGAEDSLKYGLIDSIGTIENAIEMINIINEIKYNS